MRTPLVADARQSIDFGRIGNFGERLDMSGKNVDQYELVAETQQLHFVLAAKALTSEDFEGLSRQQRRWLGHATLRHPSDD